MGRGLGTVGRGLGVQRAVVPGPGPIPELPLALPLPCSRAFQEYYQEHLEYACPTEDIYLE